MNFERPAAIEGEGNRELTPETAKDIEGAELSRFKNIKGKATMLLGAFMLMTAIGCGEKGGQDLNSASPEKGHQGSKQESVEKKTHRETREFSGYGVKIKRVVEVDEDGNVVGEISHETPYGSSK